MGIYIKGMEMPTCCGECRFLSEYGDYPVCIITDEQRGYTFRIRDFRMPCCPLVPVPPHGRLIDADALDIKRREEQAWYDYELNPDNEYLEGVKDGLHEAAKQLSVAPTIIEAEEGE